MKWYLDVNWIYLQPKKWVMLNQIEEFFSEAKFVLNWMYTSSIHLVFRSLYQLCVTFRWKYLSWSAARVNIVGTAWLIVIGIKDCLLVTYSDITFFLDANLELNMQQNVSLLFLMKGWKYYPFLKIYVNMSVLISVNLPPFCRFYDERVLHKTNGYNRSFHAHNIHDLTTTVLNYIYSSHNVWDQLKIKKLKTRTDCYSCRA